MSVEVGWRTSILGLHASVAAFTHGDDWLDATLVSLEASKALLADLLAAELPDVGFRQPDATFLAWLDFHRLDWGDDPSIRALDARVALNPGPDFGSQGRGFTRLNFACAPDVLTEAIHRLASA
jgi:cysteine-S-conjugate beta-lyase